MQDLPVSVCSFLVLPSGIPLQNQRKQCLQFLCECLIQYPAYASDPALLEPGDAWDGDVEKSGEDYLSSK
jgi:hypothetical protein